MKYFRTAFMGAVLIALMSSPTSANDEHSNRCHDRFGPSSQQGPNVIYGSLDRDRLIGTRCDDLIVGFWGSDLIIARGGEDIVLGGGGRDVIHAADGEADIIRGGGQRDRCIVDTIDTWSNCESVRVVAP